MTQTSARVARRQRRGRRAGSGGRGPERGDGKGLATCRSSAIGADRGGHHHAEVGAGCTGRSEPPGAPAGLVNPSDHFSSASSDFKMLGAFFCNFVSLELGGARRGRTAMAERLRCGASARRPRGGVPDLVGSRLPRPYHFRARIQSFQAVAAPFPGNSVLPSRPLAPHPGDRNASVQKIDDRLAGPPLEQI